MKLLKKKELLKAELEKLDMEFLTLSKEKALTKEDIGKFEDKRRLITEELDILNKLIYTNESIERYTLKVKEYKKEKSELIKSFEAIGGEKL